MRSKLADIILKSQISKDNLKLQKQFLPWDNIKTIALIISKSDTLNKSILDKFIQDSKKYIEVFYIELTEKQPSFGDWHCYTKKDKSFLNLPNKKITSELSGKNFDLVINAAETFHPFASSLSSTINAKLKSGYSSNFNEIQLVIKKSVTSNLIDYLNSVVKYLKMIKTD